MLPRGFFFRRLSKIFPCVFLNVAAGDLSLRGKHEIASFRDVFISSNYWRLYDHLSAPPKLVVDLGAHCGHFSILCHTCILERFGTDSAAYILVEALPELTTRISRTLSEVGLFAQSKIIQGLVGRRAGSAYFPHRSKTPLASKATDLQTDNSDKSLKYLDLEKIIPSGQTIDILKVDIEGSEYDLFANYEALLGRVKILLIETHGPVEKRKQLESEFHRIGFRSLSQPIYRNFESLLILGNHAN